MSEVYYFFKGRFYCVQQGYSKTAAVYRYDDEFWERLEGKTEKAIRESLLMEKPVPLEDLEQHKVKKRHYNNCGAALLKRPSKSRIFENVYYNLYNNGELTADVFAQ